MIVAEKVYLVLSFANFVGFLYNGRYLRLPDRLIGLRLVFTNAEAQRWVKISSVILWYVYEIVFFCWNEILRGASFEFINQQLLYDGFSDFLMCLLPLVELSSVQRAWKRMSSILGVMKSKIRQNFPKLTFRGHEIKLFGIATLNDTSNEVASGAQIDGHCPKCDEGLCMPFKASCGHFYCYYCLQSLVRVNSTPICLICSQLIDSSTRL